MLFAKQCSKLSISGSQGCYAISTATKFEQWVFCAERTLCMQAASCLRDVGLKCFAASWHPTFEGHIQQYSHSAFFLMSKVCASVKGSKSVTFVDGQPCAKSDDSCFVCLEPVSGLTVYAQCLHCKFCLTGMKCNCCRGGNEIQADSLVTPLLWFSICETW